MPGKSKQGSRKAAVRLKDLPAKKNPKGGAFESYLAIKGTKQGANKGTGTK